MGAIIKQGDTARPITDTLTLNGVAINLTDAVVALKVRKRADAPHWPHGDTVTYAAVVSNAATGAVSYTPTGSDFVATPGTYDIEWQITFSEGGQLTVPSANFSVVIVRPSL